MLVRKYKLNLQTDHWELMREIPDISEDDVFVKMSLDMPYENATYKYEAGKMIGNSFDPEFIWCSENANIFD